MGTEVSEYSSVNLPYRGHTRRLREKCKDQKQKISYCTSSELNTFSGPTPTRTTVVSTIFNKYRRLANDTTIVKHSPKLTDQVEDNIFGPILYIILAILVDFLLEYVPFRGSNEKGLIRTCIAMTAVCMWLFWFIIHAGQVNPLIGPRLKNTTVAWIAYKIGNPA
ncbi:uncharacterized protein LOC121732579 [Aricia agestis]|uniref:uncharacterized protein LOC121732579 n=1 Tax=Aricia agestis TaxID=91739 RepID=UPI001C20B326|nr:uncharacterized protein LOC121732579 [Aricia agestis]